MHTTYKKNIFCLESLWDGDLEQKLSVLPVLEVTAKMNDIKFIHLSCNTKAEFSYNINLISRKTSYKILYLAFHGESGEICLDDGTGLGLDELASIMKNKFENWTIHFSSCNTLKSDKDVRHFLRMTKAILVTGYAKNTGWAESAALDMLLFSWLQDYKNPKYFSNFMEKTYPDLVRRTGCRFFPKN